MIHRHAGHCWRSRDELIRDVLLWSPTHGRAKAGRPARTYIQQLCEDTGCCPKDLPRAMNDREKWWEWVRDIRATSAIWWWWYDPGHTRTCHLSQLGRRIRQSCPRLAQPRHISADGRFQTRHIHFRKTEDLSYSNLLSFLLRCGTRPYERGTQWDSNSLV